jgi:hypothetical protein
LTAREIFIQSSLTSQKTLLSAIPDSIQTSQSTGIYTKKSWLTAGKNVISLLTRKKSVNRFLKNVQKTQQMHFFRMLPGICLLL